MKVIALVFALTLGTASAEDARIIVKPGFYSGNTFVTAPDLVRQSYVMGLVDATLFAPGYSAPKSSIKAFEECTAAMTSPQLLAITDKYISQHPENRDWAMNVLFYNAMNDACKSKGYEISKPLK